MHQKRTVWPAFAPIETGVIRNCIVVQFLLGIAHIKYAQGVPKYELCLLNIQVIKFVFVFLQILRIKLPSLVE